MDTSVPFQDSKIETSHQNSSLQGTLPGQKLGFDLDLTRAVSERVDVPVIASGGVGTLEHLLAGVVEGCADAVLAASIFHFGEYTIADAKDILAANGVPVRL